VKLRHVPALGAVLLLQGQSPARAPRQADAPGVVVRYAEGMVHGFLELRNEAGAIIAKGDLLQVPRDRGVESRMVFHFPDSSVFEEEVTFTQRGVFEMQSYHLVQRGPAFANDLEVTLGRNGQYVVKTRSRRGGEQKQYDGTLDAMPADVYNGMVITIAKNLPRGESRTVHVVAFTPKPRMIRLEMTPESEVRLTNGRHALNTVNYRLKPQLGALLGFFARVLGKLPPDSHTWIVTTDVPAFVRFRGPLYDGPVWQIDLGTPAWPGP
jgi:hypothetical protein